MKPIETRLLAADASIIDLHESEITRWLVSFALVNDDAQGLVEGLVEHLVGIGLDLERVACGSDLLHPIIDAQGIHWVKGRGMTHEMYERDEGIEESEDWTQSPFYHLLNAYRGSSRGVGELRRQLHDGYEEGEFPLLDRFKREGGSDYAAFAVGFGETARLGESEGIVCSFLTARPGGFKDSDIDLLRRIVKPLALAYKAIDGINTSRVLMRTYLGEDAGRRVMNGSIERGRAESVNAVLWYSDLQRFTTIADTIEPQLLLRLLNDYADVIVSTVHEHHGQVLKFIGDGIFAMFEGRDDCDPCDSALNAAVAVRKRIDKLNQQRVSQDLPTTGFYLALHEGDVLYGNIGSRDRLDFTVVGPAVNETARIEAMCRSLDQWIVVSSTFANRCRTERDRLVSLGRYALRGVNAPQELFTLDPAALKS